MSDSVHDFRIPHEHMQPMRDMVAVRIPRPPEKVGSIHLPDMMQDVAQYNVMVGLITNMGPLAFTYKDGNGNTVKQAVERGDWVAFRPYAGTYMQGGSVMGAGGYRYLSSFADIIAIIPADNMPHPDTLLWGDTKERPAGKQQPGFDFDNSKKVSADV
jgi:co-chaperonin GroES (HSP10)